MSLSESLALVISEPSPASLWRLRGDLLGEGVAPDARVLRVIGAFHDYLDRVKAVLIGRLFQLVIASQVIQQVPPESTDTDRAGRCAR